MASLLAICLTFYIFQATDHMYSSAKDSPSKGEGREVKQEEDAGASEGWEGSTVGASEGCEGSTVGACEGWEGSTVGADHQYSQGRIGEGSGDQDHEYTEARQPRLRRILPKEEVEEEEETPSGEEAVHQCTCCDKIFPQAYRLKRHIREVHDKEKLYRCDECDKEFFKSTSLIRHKISVHEKVRPFGCPNCDSRFKDRSALKYHIKKRVCTSKSTKS